MMWLVHQVWLWMALSFLAGALLTGFFSTTEIDEERWVPLPDADEEKAPKKGQPARAGASESAKPAPEVQESPFPQLEVASGSRSWDSEELWSRPLGPPEVDASVQDVAPALPTEPAEAVADVEAVVEEPVEAVHVEEVVVVALPVTERGAAVAESVEHELVEPEPAEAQLVERDAVGADVVEAELVEAEPVVADVAEPEAVGAEVVGADVAEELSPAEKIKLELARLEAELEERAKRRREALEADQGASAPVAPETPAAEADETEGESEAAQAEAEQIEAERLKSEQAAEAKRRKAEQARARRAEAKRLRAEQAAEERAERQRAEQERAEQERVEQEQAAAQAEAERIEAERLEAERLAEAKRRRAEQAKARREEAKRLKAEQAEQERLAAERAQAERAEAERIARAQAEIERMEQAERPEDGPDDGEPEQAPADLELLPQDSDLPTSRPTWLDPEDESDAWKQGPYGAGSAYAPFDGSAPAGYPVKANLTTKLYHSKPSRFYSRTHADVFFETEEHAEAAGFVRWDKRATAAHAGLHDGAGDTSQA